MAYYKMVFNEWRVRISDPVCVPAQKMFRCAAMEAL